MSPNPSQLGEKALVIFSGGADSTICLHWALGKFSKVEAISFNYGQRHDIELDSARKICESLSVPHQVIPIDSFSFLGNNSLVDKTIEISPTEKTLEEPSLPNTFVPGRNIIFITFAAAAAYPKGITDLVTGVCQTDYSGYPDCRDETIRSLENTLSLGIDKKFKIHTPLMFLNKAESIHLAEKLGAMPSLALSHTCYEGQNPPCGTCPSCLLRSRGFAEAGVADPLLSR